MTDQDAEEAVSWRCPVCGRARRPIDAVSYRTLLVCERCCDEETDWTEAELDQFAWDAIRAQIVTMPSQRRRLVVLPAAAASPQPDGQQPEQVYELVATGLDRTFSAGDAFHDGLAIGEGGTAWRTTVTWEMRDAWRTPGQARQFDGIVCARQLPSDWMPEHDRSGLLPLGWIMVMEAAMALGIVLPDSLDWAGPPMRLR